MRRVLLGLLVVLLLGTTGCLATPGDTSQVELISSTTASGWQFDQYRNLAYPCSISGYQTFTIATKVGSDAGANAPLMVWLHGGGAGYFNTAGTPQPDAKQMTEESAATQQTALLNAGLLARVRADARGYRLLGVSYCNRDFYSGTGQTDANNPNLTAEGTAKLTSGLLSTKAAIAYTQANFPTTKTLLYGGSAGSIGTYAVAYAMQRQGVPPAGIIADASVLNHEAAADAWDQGACTLFNYSPTAGAAYATRIDPQLADPYNQVDKLVSRGDFTTPILHLWNHGDATTCGQTPMTCTLRDGSVSTMSVTECTHAPLAAAIDAQNPGGASENMGRPKLATPS